MSLRRLILTRSAFPKSAFQTKQLATRLLPTTQKANYATISKDGRSIRIPPLAIGLVGGGLICLGLGLYEYLTSDIQKFPVPVRQSLRKALYYQHNKDLTLALKYFNETLELALQSELDPRGDPLTGIMIQQSAVEERLGRLPNARQSLILALRHVVGLQESPEAVLTDFDLTSLTPAQQKRAVSIAQKLGDITAAMKRDQEAEKWYVWSVEHLLRSSSRPKSEYGDTSEVVFDQEHMPEWLTKTDIGASLEALGGFYSSRNKPGLAIHLYLRALSLEGMKSCQSAVLMNNLAESYTGLGQFDEAKAWGQKGLDLAQNPNTSKVNKDSEVCDEACGVLLFNMGMIFEQTKDRAKAAQFYESAKTHGRKLKQPECIKEADRALKRLAFEKEREN